MGSIDTSQYPSDEVFSRIVGFLFCFPFGHLLERDTELPEAQWRSAQ